MAQITLNVWDVQVSTKDNLQYQVLHRLVDKADEHSGIYTHEKTKQKLSTAPER